VIRATAQLIGTHTASNYGKEIAFALELPNYEKYTGHCWRRTTITIGANAGLTLPQLKALSGHKSDTVLQKYIDNSGPMKATVSEAIQVGKKGRFLSLHMPLQHPPPVLHLIAALVLLLLHTR
jgi:integrase